MSNDYQLIQPAVLMDAAGDSSEAFVQLLEIFLRTVPEMALRLDRAVASRAAADVASDMHALKSCLALVGARDCAARAGQIERGACLGGPVDAQGWTALRADLERVLDEARACRAAHAPPPA